MEKEQYTFEKGGMAMGIQYTLFTKYWKSFSLEQTAEKAANMGFNGVEMPVRAGFQVTPDSAPVLLPAAQKIFTQQGCPILRIAAPLTEPVFQGCAKAGIPAVRIMFTGENSAVPFWDRFEHMLQTLKQALPLCREYEVKIAVQPHYGPGISNSMELYELLRQCDSPWVGGVWDAGHAGLAGEPPEQGLDILWPYLMWVNFKAAFYCPADGSKWKPFFTNGEQSLCSWERAAAYLKCRQYDGVVCIFAEYTEEIRTGEFVKTDLEYVKALFDRK